MESKVDDLLHSLEVLTGQHAREPDAVKTLEAAAKALLFIQHIGRTRDFWAYANRFNTAEAWPKPVRSFLSQEDARAWLRTQPSVPYEAVLDVAGAFFNVTRAPDGEWAFIRLPSLEELGSSEE